MRAGVFLILFYFSATCCWSQTTEIISDLRDQWKVSKGEHFLDYQGEPVHTIHLFVTDQFKGGIISMKAPGEFAVFVNGQLLVRAKLEFNLHVDSLLSKRAGVPLLSIFQKGNVKTIRTELVHKVSLENANIVRASTHFKDFVILSALLLFGFFVMLFRSNTRLTIDYLNLAKVFSVQEREDAIVTGRIGSSVNILFFVFISLLWGLLLLIIFTNGPLVLQKISIHSTAGAFGWWLLVSLLVFVFLVVKLALGWIMSSLFGFKGLVRFQFFNFIRSLYVASALMGLVLLSYFVMELKNPDFFYFVLASGCGFMMLSAFFFFLKLMTRTSSAVFHLFSYLCGSEIISLMILIKVLLN